MLSLEGRSRPRHHRSSRPRRRRQAHRCPFRRYRRPSRSRHRRCRCGGEVTTREAAVRDHATPAWSARTPTAGGRDRPGSRGERSQARTRSRQERSLRRLAGPPRTSWRSRRTRSGTATGQDARAAGVTAGSGGDDQARPDRRSPARAAASTRRAAPARRSHRHPPRRTHRHQRKARGPAAAKRHRAQPSRPVRTDLDEQALPGCRRRIDAQVRTLPGGTPPTAIGSCPPLPPTAATLITLTPGRDPHRCSEPCPRERHRRRRRRRQRRTCPYQHRGEPDYTPSLGDRMKRESDGCCSGARHREHVQPSHHETEQQDVFSPCDGSAGSSPVHATVSSTSSSARGVTPDRCRDGDNATTSGLPRPPRGSAAGEPHEPETSGRGVGARISRPRRSAQRAQVLDARGPPLVERDACQSHRVVVSVERSSYTIPARHLQQRQDVAAAIERRGLATTSETGAR